MVMPKEAEARVRFALERREETDRARWTELASRAARRHVEGQLGAKLGEVLGAEFKRQGQGNSVAPRQLTLARLTPEDQDCMMAAIPAREYTKAIRVDGTREAKGKKPSGQPAMAGPSKPEAESRGGAGRG